MVESIGVSEDSEAKHIQQLVSEIPAPILEELVQKWHGSALKLTEENKTHKFEKTFKDIPRSWKLQLERLRRLTGINQITWCPYLMENTPTFTPSMFDKPVKFSTDDLITTEVAVQGYLHVFTLPGEVYLLTMEFRSRSNKYRNAFHYLMVPSKNLLFVEVKENCMHFFEEIWNDILTLELKEIPIRPVDIRKVITAVRNKKKTEKSRDKINLLGITISQIISGFTGLSGIILSGEDVLEGMYGMKVRHDLSIDFSDLGPWTEIRTDNIHLIAGEGIRVKNLDGISYAIDLFAP